MIDKQELYSGLNEGILAERYRAFERNLGKNAGLIKKHGGLRRIVGRLAGRHAVIIGAGPSLEKNFDVLRKYQLREEFVLIAMDMALKPLALNGIVPGLVFSCETTPVDFFGSVNTEKMHLVAFSCMASANLHKWQGDMSFYNWMLDDPRYEKLWEKAGRDLGFLATGNTVTTQAVSFALGCDIRSLVMAGNDLGFSEKYYVRGTVSYSKFINTHDRLMPVERFDMNTMRNTREYEVRRGEKVFYTNNQFLAAKLWLEELFKKNNCPVYDCSIPGCSETRVNKIELSEFFKLFDRKKKKKRR